MIRKGIVAHAHGRMAVLLARYKLRRCVEVGCRPRVVGKVWIHGEGSVLIGARVFIDAETAPIELYAWQGASIVIGDDAYIAGGTSIDATRSIVLGARVHLGGFCKVMDNHFHPLVGDRNKLPAPHPVIVEDDVRFGPRAIVMAGALVARGTHVRAGVVVRRPVDVGAAANG